MNSNTEFQHLSQFMLLLTTTISSWTVQYIKKKKKKITKYAPTQLQEGKSLCDTSSFQMQ